MTSADASALAVVIPAKAGIHSDALSSRRPGEGRDPVPFARYPEYKDSGVEWLGEVPAHWEIARTKASVASCRNGIWGSEESSDDNDIPCVRVADFDRNRLVVDQTPPTIRNVSVRERGGRLLSNGNLLLEKSGGGEGQPVGCVVLYDCDALAVCSNFVARMELRLGMVPSFWRYVHAAAYAIRLTTRSINQTSGIQNLDQDRYFNERAAFPPAEEQSAIANFLDRETGKIDALIAEQERLVALLKEKRQALISHAVTKGLDPNAPMKDSGIEWLGQVPAHWDVCQMRRALACKLTNGIFKRKEEFGDGTLLVNVFDAYRPDFKVDFAALDRVRCDVNEQGAYAVEDGDILFVRSSLKAEGVAVAVLVECPHENVVFECHLIRARLRVETALPRFASFLLSSSQYRDRLVSLAKITTMTTIEQESLASLPIVLPPVLEQVEIAAKLDREIGTFDMLAESAQHTIDLLKERRAALISAAVTGKICVLDS